MEGLLSARSGFGGNRRPPRLEKPATRAPRSTAATVMASRVHAGQPMVSESGPEFPAATNTNTPQSVSRFTAWHSRQVSHFPWHSRLRRDMFTTRSLDFRARAMASIISELKPVPTPLPRL